MTEQQTLAEFFEFEVCGECGCGAEQHRVISSSFGPSHPFIQCKFPIAATTSEAEYMTELNRRMEHHTA